MRKQNLKMLIAIALIGMTCSFRILEGEDHSDHPSHDEPRNIETWTRAELNFHLRQAVDNNEMQLSLDIATELVSRDFDLHEDECELVIQVFLRAVLGLKMRVEWAKNEFEGRKEEKIEMMNNAVEKLVCLIEDLIKLIEKHVVPNV